MSFKVLAVNPGSTSTKVAVYEDEKELFTRSLAYSADVVARYPSVVDQFEMRKDHVLALLKESGIDVRDLSAVVGRGGMLPPVKSGAYEVNEAMVKRLRFNPVREHASNLGALIAYDIAQGIGVKAFIYDSVMVDELLDVARITGFPEITRTSTSHVLNSRAMAIKCARNHGKAYRDLCFIVAHLGGGISCSLHDHGRLADVINDVEGPFSPERSGRLPGHELVDLCYSGTLDRMAMHRRMEGNGGLKAYLNTVDIREVIRMGKEGKAQAKLLLEAMCYQIAKGVGELATVVCGKVDHIILTGGIAYAEEVTALIKPRVEFIAPVEIMPGENEMEALALGTLRVLRDEERAWEYADPRE